MENILDHLWSEDTELLAGYIGIDDSRAHLSALVRKAVDNLLPLLDTER